MTAPADFHLARPGEGNGTGVLVLAGSSGRLDRARADVLSSLGATALALRWFGGAGQPPTPCEVPLETFTGAIDLLAAECRRIVVLGLSYGAEAALLTAVRDARVDAVVALSPTDVVWEGHRHQDDAAARSKWSWQGQPLPFVPMDRTWSPAGEPVAFTPWYRASRAAATEVVLAAARIPVEEINGEVLLVAGGDDQVWPSLDHARGIESDRRAEGLATTLVTDPAAGHQVVLPGEPVGGQRRAYAVGGGPDGARSLGERAWPAIRRILSR